jgi:hypothetical protein
MLTEKNVILLSTDDKWRCFSVSKDKGMSTYSTVILGLSSERGADQAAILTLLPASLSANIPTSTLALARRMFKGNAAF